MMGLNRGLVMEVRKRSCVVVTGDGQFLEVSRPRDGAELGQEIVFGRPALYRFKTTYLAVASIMVAVLAWFAFNSMLPRAVAYVALDINPSLELGIDGKRQIISARGVNDDGKELLQRVMVVHDPLAEGVQKIIAGCIEYQYLNPGQDNLVLATVTDAKRTIANKEGKDSKESMEIKEVHDFVYTSINNSINESGVGAELIVADIDLDTMKKARDNGVTPGRYLLQEEAHKNGVKITNQELREEHIRELEVKKNFRAGELIQKRTQTGFLGKPDKPDKPGKPDKPNDPVSLSPRGDNVNNNNQAESNSAQESKTDKSSHTDARGKRSVPRDNGHFSKKQGPPQRDIQLQKRDNSKPKKANRDKREKTIKEDNKKG